MNKFKSMIHWNQKLIASWDVADVRKKKKKRKKTCLQNQINTAKVNYFFHCYLIYFLNQKLTRKIIPCHQNILLCTYSLCQHSKKRYRSYYLSNYLHYWAVSVETLSKLNAQIYLSEFYASYRIMFCGEKL